MCLERYGQGTQQYNHTEHTISLSHIFILHQIKYAVCPGW